MNWEKIDHRMKKALSEERYRHTLGVVKTAVEMAERYGEDTEKARLAAYLHDCAKCLTLDEMKKAAKDLPHDPLAETSKALMHAAAGMCVARDEFHVEDPDVLGAIRWHTTGKPGMTKLEKIIYLADMIEPNRKPCPGLDALRRTCRTDLDEAMKLGLSMSVGHVRAQGKPVHPDTQRAIDAYADSKQQTD